jgi:hypothetical protein
MAAGWVYETYSHPQNYGGEVGTTWGITPILTDSQIRFPSDTFMWIEDGDQHNGGWNVGTWVVNWSQTAMLYGHPQSFTWNDPVPMCHGNVSTFGFADGHAGFHKWTDGAVINAGTKSAYGTRTSPVSVSPGPVYGDSDYNYIYNGYRFPGWH